MSNTSVSANAPGRAYVDIPNPGLLAGIRGMLAAGGGGRADMYSTLRDMYDAYGPVVRQRGAPIRFLQLFGPDANRLVLLDKDSIFSARRPWMEIMGRIFPNGLLLRDGDDHRRHRRIMQAAFKTPVLQIYAQRMNPMIAGGIDGWGDTNGDPFLAFPAFKKLTLAMAASIFLGEELGAGTAQMNEAFENMVAASMSLIKLRIPGLEFYRGLKGREYMTDFIKQRLADKRAGDGTDLFSRLCHATSEDGESYSDGDVVDHLVFLMMAAHDTTTSTLTSMAYELAKHPEWQARVREESRALGAEQPAFDDFDTLTSLTWVMKETLRHYPALPIIPRVATEDFEIGGYVIPADTMVVLSPIHTHHMAEWWSDPFTFDPERFSPERAEQDRHTHSWIPFGGGPHLCLGLRFAETQIRAVMHQLVLRYEWSVPADYTMPVQQAPISKPRDGLPLRLTPLA